MNNRMDIDDKGFQFVGIDRGPKREKEAKRPKQKKIGQNRQKQTEIDQHRPKQN